MYISFTTDIYNNITYRLDMRCMIINKICYIFKYFYTSSKVVVYIILINCLMYRVLVFNSSIEISISK